MVRGFETIFECSQEPQETCSSAFVNSPSSKSCWKKDRRVTENEMRRARSGPVLQNEQGLSQSVSGHGRFGDGKSLSRSLSLIERSIETFPNIPHSASKCKGSESSYAACLANSRVGARTTTDSRGPPSVGRGASRESVGSLCERVRKRSHASRERERVPGAPRWSLKGARSFERALEVSNLRETMDVSSGIAKRPAKNGAERCGPFVAHFTRVSRKDREFQRRKRGLWLGQRTLRSPKPETSSTGEKKTPERLAERRATCRSPSPPRAAPTCLPVKRPSHFQRSRAQTREPRSYRPHRRLEPLSRPFRYDVSGARPRSIEIGRCLVPSESTGSAAR